MGIRFVPRTDILPEPQRRLWHELDCLPAHFALYGGTAVALHLGHRISEDFDFFGERSVDPDALLAELPFLAGAVVTQRAKNTLSVVADRGGPVRVSFFGVPSLPRLAPPHQAPDNGVRVASLLDLAGTKASVIQVRSETKDYLDLDAILSDGRVDLPMALAAAKAIYGAQFNPEITLKALCFFGDGDLHRLSEAVRQRLVKAVRGIDLDRLPDLGGTARR